MYFIISNSVKDGWPVSFLYQLNHRVGDEALHVDHVAPCSRTYQFGVFLLNSESTSCSFVSFKLCLMPVELFQLTS